mgnify:CR=1 FL=1
MRSLRRWERKTLLVGVIVSPLYFSKSVLSIWRSDSVVLSTVIEVLAIQTIVATSLSMCAVRGCFHDTGATFAPARVRSSSLSWVCVCLHVATKRCYAGATHNDAISLRLLKSRAWVFSRNTPLVQEPYYCLSVDCEIAAPNIVRSRLLL